MGTNITSGSEHRTWMRVNTQGPFLLQELVDVLQSMLDMGQDPQSIVKVRTTAGISVIEVENVSLPQHQAMLA